MCTALKHNTCFGRNYDYEQSFNEQPRKIQKNEYGNKYEIIGICTGAIKTYPMLYDGMNQHGLCMAGLAFTGNAKYTPETGKKQYRPYNFILEILGQCKNTEEAKTILQDACMIDEPYSQKLPNAELHWIISDKNKSITVEATKNGLNTYDNPYEVLTNNPPFPNMTKHLPRLLSTIGAYNPYTEQEWKTRGSETTGIRGDLTSVSRFERAAYFKKKIQESGTPFNDSIETRHILEIVEQVYGATPVSDKYEYTIYSAVYDMKNLNLHMKNYDGSQTSLKIR